MKWEEMKTSFLNTLKEKPIRVTLAALTYDLLVLYLSTQLHFEPYLIVNLNNLYSNYLKFLYHHESFGIVLKNQYENFQTLNNTILPRLQKPEVPIGVVSRRKFWSTVHFLPKEMEKEVKLYKSTTVEFRGIGIQGLRAPLGE